MSAKATRFRVEIFSLAEDLLGLTLMNEYYKVVTCYKAPCIVPLRYMAIVMI